MSCVHPLKAWRYLSPDFVTSKRLHFLRQDFDMSLVSDNAGIEYLEVPCGKCVQCRLQYSRNWADRCMLEAQEYEFNDFITLTYNEENVPINDDYCSKTLQPKDLTDFMKRLRQAFVRGQYRVDGNLLEFPKNENIRFFACGEYGGQFGRPHYHLIVFNFLVPDLKFWYTNPQGHAVYRSALLEALWGKGYVTCAGSVNWDMCAYTARYVMKKQKGPHSAEYYADRGLVPEFVRMSRRPGIGRKYFDDHGKKIYEYDAIWLKKSDGRLDKIKPARYYDQLYDVLEPEKMAAVKEKRKQQGKIANENRMFRTSLSDEEYNRQTELLSNEIVNKQLNRNYENEKTLRLE